VAPPGLGRLGPELQTDVGHPATRRLGGLQLLDRATELLVGVAQALSESVCAVAVPVGRLGEHALRQ
jgi:hypothetical protein